MKNIKLRTKLIIVVLVCLIPMILLNSLMISFQYKRTVNQELKASQEYAEAIGIAFTNYVERIWSSELIMSKYITEYPTPDSSHLNQYLQNCVSEFPAVRSFSWVDSDGTFKYSSNPDVIGTTLKEYDFYDRIINGEERVVSDVVISKTSKIISIAVARGIRENGELKGILFSGINLDKLGMVMPPDRLGETGNYGLVDRNGLVVFRSTTPNLLMDERRIKDDSPTWDALRGEVSVKKSYISSIDGTARIGVNIPIRGIGWAAYAGVTEEEVFRETNTYTLLNIFTMVIVIFISLVIALYIIRDSLQGIRILENAANAISRSDFSVRTNLQRNDEIGHTGMAFDKMAKHILELEESRMLFLQTAAHELRNPMTSVKGITSLIHRNVNTGKPMDQNVQLIDTLNNEVCRLAGLLNQILEAFSSERENIKIKANMQPVDISQVIISAVNLYRMDTSNDTTIISNSSASIWVMGDNHRLEDVIRNLLNNAMKYSPKNSVINVNAYEVDGFAVITVKDQGVGIPQEHLTKVFNSFHRIKMDVSDPGGLGLGLYICKDIILRHGGDIWVENNEDKGCTFYINLPLAKNIGHSLQ